MSVDHNKVPVMFRVAKVRELRHISPPQFECCIFHAVVVLQSIQIENLEGLQHLRWGNGPHTSANHPPATRLRRTKGRFHSSAQPSRFLGL